MVVGIKMKTKIWLQHQIFEFWYDCQIRERSSKEHTRSVVGMEEGESLEYHYYPSITKLNTIFGFYYILFPIRFGISYTVYGAVADWRRPPYGPILWEL